MKANSHKGIFHQTWVKIVFPSPCQHYTGGDETEHHETDIERQGIGTKVEEEDGGDEHNIDQKAGEEANITRHLRRPRFFRDYPLAVRHRF